MVIGINKATVTTVRPARHPTNTATAIWIGPRPVDCQMTSLRLATTRVAKASKARKGSALTAMAARFASLNDTDQIVPSRDEVKPSTPSLAYRSGR